MNKKLLGLFTILILGALFFAVKEKQTSFHRFESPIDISQKIQPSQQRKRSLSEKKITKKGITLHRSKTLQKYEKMKDLPSGLIPNKEVDLLLNKFTPQKKQALSNTGNLQLEVLPSHYYISSEEQYILTIHSSYKSAPTNSKVTIKSDSFEINPKAIATGYYEIPISSQNLKPGKNYLTITATTHGEEAFASLSLQMNPHYFDFISSLDSGLDPEGNLFFLEQFNFLEKGDYTIEGVVYHKGKPFAQVSKILRNVVGVQDVELNFYGHLFYNNKVEGVFQLKSLQVTKITSNLASTGDSLLNIQHQSPSIEWEMFNSKPFENEAIIDKIKTLRNH